MDGFTVAERILSSEGMRGVTVLMLTSAERSNDVRRCRELGLAAYLVKPVTQKELRSTLLRVLSGASAAGTAGIDKRVPIADSPLRILLAEDNAVNQKVAVAMLSRLGHHVVVAPDGQAAIDAYRREVFDIILMDVQMPVVSGYDATRAIRAIERTAGTRVPIIAMTARAMKGDRETCLEAGMDDYLSKPIHRQLVVEVIRRTLQSSASLSKRSDLEEPAAVELASGDGEVP
jgi:CheY-like chemotaxis protein